MRMRAGAIVPLVTAMLSILDGVATAYVLSIGVEENAIVAAAAIESYGSYSILFKVLVSILSCFIFYRFWYVNRLARYSCIVAALVYLVIDVVHVLFLLGVDITHIWFLTIIF